MQLSHLTGMQQFYRLNTKSRVAAKIQAQQNVFLQRVHGNFPEVIAYIFH